MDTYMASFSFFFFFVYEMIIKVIPVRTVMLTIATEISLD